MPVKDHRHTPEEKRKARTIAYTLGEKDVCKRTFANILGVTFSRLDYLYRKKMSSTGVPTRDQRGSNAPANRILHTTLGDVQNFFDRFPKYTSHYSNSGKLYFPPYLTQAKLFTIFKDEHRDVKISSATFRKEFKKLNVSFYVPKRDTCGKCDEFKASLDSCQSQGEEREVIESRHRTHKTNAECARKKLKDAEKRSKQEPSFLCFTFDLEKTQPIPYLNTNVVYYKRQMWMYNLGINTRHDNKGYMQVWTETQGKRGSVEIVSCISEFLSNMDISKIDHIHTFSDCCGGQNRNKTVLAFIVFFVNSNSNLTWRHTFLESGHTFLPNDTDFGKIEKVKNRQTIGLYTLDHWIQLIKSSSNFDVTAMENKMFDFSILCSKYNFKSKSSDGEKLKWRELRDFTVRSGNNVIEFSYSHLPDAQVSTVNLGDYAAEPLSFSRLYGSKIKLSKEKYKDILSLLKFIPQAYSGYLTDLPHQQDDSAVNVEEHPDIFDDIE